MIKICAVILLSILANDMLIASNIPETEAPPLKNGSFVYKKEVFSLHITSNIDQDNPSLAGLYQDALTRKSHLDALLKHVQENKFDAIKNKELIEHANYRHMILRNWKFEDRPQDLRVIHLLKSEYMVERDLVDFFLQALGNLTQTQPTKEQIQELYQQAVYTCRKNLSSLQANLFQKLAYTYPKFYWFGSDNDCQYQDKNFTAYLNNEDRAYADFLNQFPNGADTDTLDTIAITKLARYGIRPHVTFTSPDIILELNSLFFYLNIERALLSMCPDLVFKPGEYKFEKSVTSQSNKFVFSRISDHHRQGAFYTLMQNSRADKKKLNTYLKMKNRLLETSLKSSAQESIDFFLTKLFPVTKKIEAPIEIGSTLTQNSQPIGIKKTTRKPKKSLNTSSQTQDAHVLQNPTSLTALLTQEKPDVEVLAPATPEELQEFEALIAAQETKKSTYVSPSTAQQPAAPLLIPAYKSNLHVDDYTYKRCIFTAENGSYSFLGQILNMPPMFFDINMLRQIKKRTHHYPEDSRLQNLASYRLRFHFRHENGSLDMMDFISPYQYLSGGRNLDAQYRQKHHIKVSLHDYLTPSQAQIYLKDKESTDRSFLLTILSEQIKQHVVQGPWHHNCADSEALMLIDLQKEMPTMLQKIVSQAGEKITLLGAVLGASTYHDPCWRCRNLFQGWQWGLSDTITHWKDVYHLAFSLSPDFSTIVFGFGEVAPQSRDFYPPRANKTVTVLGTSDIDAKRHKLTMVSLKKKNP